MEELPKQITIKRLECNRCGAQFYPILELDGEIKLPLRCRNRPCSSPYWNRARVRKLKPKEQLIANRL